MWIERRWNPGRKAEDRKTTVGECIEMKVITANVG